MQKYCEFFCPTINFLLLQYTIKYYFNTISINSSQLVPFFKTRHFRKIIKLNFHSEL